MLEHFQKLASRYTTRNYDSGSTIIFQGEVPQNACLLLSGTVRVFNISFQGEEQTIGFHVAGDFFPSLWIFDKTPTSVYFYEAMTDAKVCFIPRKDFLDSFVASAASSALLTDYLSGAYTISQLRIIALSQSRSQEKIMLTLYYLCQGYGSLQDDKTVKISLKLTHHHIASLIGLTRETTATELSKLKRKKIVNYKNQQYTVDVQKLLRSIGEDSLSSLRLNNH